MIQIESFFGAEALAKTTQLNGKRSLVTYERVGRLLSRRLRPQLEVRRVQTAHLEMVQGEGDAPRRRVVRTDAERLHLQATQDSRTPSTDACETGFG